jgi:predicted NAD-dependent protein-ADP-ribosyltransferase YbiA (DUF1768 family)
MTLTNRRINNTRRNQQLVKMSAGAINSNKKRKAEEQDVDGKGASNKKERKESRSVLMFNSKSKAVKPFSGAQETLALGDSLDNYSLLCAHTGFRKVLSAFHVTAAPLSFHGDRLYATQEHAYHAQKFIRLHPEFARLFDLRSGSVFCTNPVLAKMAGGKSGKVRVEKKVVYQRPKNVAMDPEFSSTGEVMVKIFTAKYRADAAARAILLGTGNAILTHWTRGKSAAIVEHDLMRVREILAAENVRKL